MASEAPPERPLSGFVARFPALRHRNFRLFVVGQGISLIGFWMQSVAQGWLVFHLRERPLDLGTVAFAGYLPILLLGSPGGVVADRLPRRPILLATQTVFMLLAAGLGIVVLAGAVTVPIMVAYAGVVGLVSALDVPTRQAFLVEMAGPEDLPNAIALNSSIFNGARVVGPAIGGVLVAAVGVAPCMLLNAASYLAVLAALAAMRLPARARSHGSHATATGFRSGLRYVWGVPVLRNLLLLLGVVCCFGVQYAVLMPVFANVFGADSLGYGLLLSAAGIGSVASSLQLASRRYSRLQHRRNLLFGLVLFAVSLLGLAASPRLELALVCQLLAGYGMVRYLATTNTLLQLFVDEGYRGRVMGLHTVMFLGTQPFGSLFLSGIAQRVGARRAAL
ncbi:MAG TPA: MFS transporter, partial [Candidatus Binatia bacterium]|nr:MFS transporter [Candidatus Binatia bacterium]